MNIRYPIYEGVYRILTKHSESMCSCCSGECTYFFSRWRLSCRRSVHNVADDFRKHYRDRVTGSSVSGHGLPETAQHPTDDAAPVACTVPQQGVDKYLSVRLAGNYGTLYGIQLRRAVSGADCSAGRESHYVGSDACGTVRYSRKRFVFPIFRSEVRFAPVYGLFGHGGLFSVIVSAFRFYESGTCLVFLLGNSLYPLQLVASGENYGRIAAGFDHFDDHLFCGLQSRNRLRYYYRRSGVYTCIHCIHRLCRGITALIAFVYCIRHVLRPLRPILYRG